MHATMTTKGQVTLPKALRDSLHLRTGDRLIFEETENGAFLVKPCVTDVTSLKGCANYTGRTITVEEMNQAIEQEAGKMPR